MQEFNVNASANELGVHVRLGDCVTTVPDPAYAAPEYLVRMIRREIDPHFIPLWANILWRSPNGGVVRTGHHMLGRHVRNPQHGAPVIKGLVMPTTNHYCIKYEQPILEANMLDGLSDDDRKRGVLPYYVPFDRSLVEAMRYAMWARNNMDPVKRAQAIEDAEIAAEVKADANLHSELSYARRHDGNRLRRAVGTADRVYVSDTLVKLRAIASGEAA